MEDLLDGLPEVVGERDRQRQRRRVALLLDGVDGLARDVHRLRERLLRELPAGAEGADVVLHGWKADFTSRRPLMSSALYMAGLPVLSLGTPDTSSSRPRTALLRRMSQHDHRLAKDALGLPAVLFCIVTGAAPLAAMMFNVPVAVSGGGYAVPAAFLVATVALTIFSVGYIEMSQRVTSTGGFYTFISRGLGNVLGLGSGILIALCYVIFAAAVTGVLGYFASTTIDDWFGISMPAYVYMFGALALMTGFAWFHIELTAKILGVALVAEVLALLAMCIGIIVSG